MSNEPNQLPKALLNSQKEMGNAVKDSANPFFKTKYADLNSIRAACMPILNRNGIVVLQPTAFIEGKNFIKTILLHESGESMESLTEIVYSKPNDAQSQGSGITYARRYGLQSFVNIGADDDDGRKASIALPELTPSSPKWVGACEALRGGKFLMKDIEAKYTMTAENRERLITESI